MRLLLRWAAAAAAVGVAAWLLPGIRVTGGVQALLVVAVVLGLVNALVRPLVRALACGLIALTLGLFLFVINAVMLLLAAWLTRSLGFGFEVDGFTTALLGSVIISLASWALSLVIGDGDREG